MLTSNKILPIDRQKEGQTISHNICKVMVHGSFFNDTFTGITIQMCVFKIQLLTK